MQGYWSERATASAIMMRSFAYIPFPFSNATFQPDRVIGGLGFLYMYLTLVMDQPYVSMHAQPGWGIELYVFFDINSLLFDM